MDEKEYTDENTIVEIEPVDEEEVEETENISKVSDDEIVVNLKKEKKAKEKKTKNKKEVIEETNPLEATKSKKRKKPCFWKRLSKKGKIIISITGVIILLGITATVLYFCGIFDKKKSKTDEDNVVLKEDNYIYENGKLKFLDENGDTIGTYSCKDKNEKKCYVANLSNEDTFDLPVYEDENGKLLEKRSKIYNNNYVFVYDEGTIGLFDIKKQSRIGEYQLIKTGDIEEKLVVAKDKNNKYGILDLESSKVKTIVDFEYEYLGIYNSSESFVAKDGTSSFLIDYDGKKISTETRGEIKGFDSTYIAIKNEDYELYDYAGNKVLSDSYDFIDFINDYVFVMKGVKLYAYDKSLCKLNEAPIKLKTSDYKKTYIFDKDDNLKETKKAYSMSFTADQISIELDETNTKTINLLEAQINKNYDYVNYFDGILYVYSDAEKTDLLGSYSCSNKNTTGEGITSYTNCFIAKDTVIANEKSSGYIPIINGNYVFINDTKTGASSNNIILYDLAKSKNKVTYHAVDTGLGNENIDTATITNTVIFAKNKNDYFGAITFGNDGPVKIIEFTENGEGTTKISLLDNYILVKRGKTNYLYDRIGTKLATSQFEIVEYKDGYVLVKNKERYTLYTMPNGNSGSIISGELDSIEMFDDFFIGIENKKLNVYYYTNGTDKLLFEDIPVKDNKKSSYKITINSDTYVITVIESDTENVNYTFNKDWSKVGNEE